jgi:MFS family permease
MLLTVFNAGATGSKNIQTLIILRFLAGAFGSSPLTNAGGVIADMFPASHRGLATSIFAAAPFLGPVIGPIGKCLDTLPIYSERLFTYIQQLAALLVSPWAGGG